MYKKGAGKREIEESKLEAVLFLNTYLFSYYLNLIY